MGLLFDLLLLFVKFHYLNCFVHLIFFKVTLIHVFLCCASVNLVGLGYFFFLFKNLETFLNAYFQAPSFSSWIQSVIFLKNFGYGFWSMPFFLTLNAHCPVLISRKIYTFLTDKTRDAVYGRPPWAHKSIKETQFAGKTICCSTKQWGHTNHIKSHRFHFRISYLQLGMDGYHFFLISGYLDILDTDFVWILG